MKLRTSQLTLLTLIEIRGRTILPSPGMRGLGLEKLFRRTLVLFHDTYKDIKSPAVFK